MAGGRHGEWAASLGKGVQAALEPRGPGHLRGQAGDGSIASDEEALRRGVARNLRSRGVGVERCCFPQLPNATPPSVLMALRHCTGVA